MYLANDDLMKKVKDINDRRAGGRSKGFSIMKGVFRMLVEDERKPDFVEYAPCVEGAVPAFLHSARNLRKFLHASSKIHKATRVYRMPFDPQPYINEFGTRKVTNVTDAQWFHAFNAMNVSKNIYFSIKQVSFIENESFWFKIGLI